MLLVSLSFDALSDNEVGEVDKQEALIDKATIQKRALLLASTGVTGIGTALAQEFGITRQAAAAHLRTRRRSCFRFR